MPRLRSVAWFCLVLAACLGRDGEQSLYGCDGVEGSGLQVISPNGGEVWAKRHDAAIRWSGQPEVEFVRIELLQGDEVVETISEQEANTGALDYRVPISLSDGDGYRVRITGESESDSGIVDYSDSDFRIELRDVILTEPNGGERLLAGTPHAITWMTSGAVDEVNIELRRDSGDVVELAQGAPNTGVFNWTPPFDLAPADDYRVRIIDPVASIYDESLGDFTIDNWRYRRPMTITSTYAFAVTNFPVMVEFDSGDFDFSDADATGDDLRFATSEERTNGYDVEYYIDKWSALTGARVWVRVPSLPAGSSTTLHMFYGAPVAPDESDYDGTFPDRFVSSGNVTLGGTQEYDTFELAAGHTLTVVPGAPLVIRARILEIAGTIEGAGAGNPGGVVGLPGSGPGGGGTSSTGGSGGGGYGGLGGDGGADFGDTPGAGGSAYGTTIGVDIAMGSGGGGASDSHAGGDGGGAVSLYAYSVVMSGIVNVSGESGSSCNGCRAAGGGAGGGILIEAHEAVVSGWLDAFGGDGGDGFGFGDDGGGGAGGGRIKLFYSGSMQNSALLDVSGGTGGLGDSPANGDPGGQGTTHLEARARWEPAVNIGAEVVLFP